ncbi:MAG: hypothetical protein K5643_06505 [Saccharofermentans sp.]|nr:hypothetical protein [Saccharofermentans sp.]
MAERSMKEKLTKYSYHPKNPKKLRLREVLHKLRDFRLLFIFSIPLWFMWIGGMLAVISVWISYPYMKEEDRSGIIIFTAAMIFAAVLIVLIYLLIFAIKKHQDMKAVVINTKKYLPDLPEDFTKAVEKDLEKGMPYLKSHNLGISKNYVFGNLTLVNFTPVIIPKKEIVEVLYEIFEGASTTVAHNGHVTNARNFYQYFFFRLKNGLYVPVQVNDKFKLDLALAAIERAGLKTVELDRGKIKDALRSKKNRNTYVKESERIIVRKYDVTKIVPFPNDGNLVSFEKLYYGEDDDLHVSIKNKDGQEMDFVMDEESLIFTAV